MYLMFSLNNVSNNSVLVQLIGMHSLQSAWTENEPCIWLSLHSNSLKSHQFRICLNTHDTTVPYGS